MKITAVMALSLALTPLVALAGGEEMENKEIEDRVETDPNTGLLTTFINKAMIKAADKQTDTTGVERKVRYGRQVTDWVSVPVIGTFYTGAYKYSSQQGKHNGSGFTSRMARLYISGTILKDFGYRVQIEFASEVHLKDAWMEWKRFKEIQVRAGQMKRVFTFENPYSPWDVGVGDYSQMTKKLAGYSDFSGTENSYSNGGRDFGLQLQGDLLPVGRDRHRLFHYQMGVFNGQGINNSDENGKKDWMGTIQVQPVRNLYVGVFGWKGSFTGNDVTVERNRWAVGMKYESDRISARAEYAHHTGHKTSDYNAETGTWSGTARADGWYATFGYGFTPWLKVYGKYDAYRDDATNSSLKSIYSLCPNIQLHKNLLFQVQYNYVKDKTLTTSRTHYHEFWTQFYVRL